MPNLPSGTTQADLLRSFRAALCDELPPMVRDPRLLMGSDNGVDVYYAPIDYVNPSAKVVLVGITPGPTQMSLACTKARELFLAGTDLDSIPAAVKPVAAFGGEPMRSNLIRQLDDWGVPAWLGIASAAELFGDSKDLVHTTSLIRYPAFINNQPLAKQISIGSSMLLQECVNRYFLEEVKELTEAVFIGLGAVVHTTLSGLISSGSIPSRQVALGMMHPSGNNTPRINWLLGDRDPAGKPPGAKWADDYDQGRSSFRTRFL